MRTRSANHEDYVLRLIRQAAEALRRLRLRLTGADGAPAAVRHDAAAAVSAFLGADAPLLARLDPHSAVRLLGDAQRVALWHGLLDVEAAAAEGEGDAAGAAAGGAGGGAARGRARGGPGAGGAPPPPGGGGGGGGGAARGRPPRRFGRNRHRPRGDPAGTVRPRRPAPPRPPAAPPVSVRARPALPADVPALVGLMAEFYGEAGFPLPAEAAARAFAALLADPRLGRAWVLEADGAPAGYVVLTVGFSMEYGGLRGFVDDLFVRVRARGRGLAAAGLAEARRAAEAMGVRALLVETGPENDRARRVYARAGFTDGGRLLLALPLAPAVHETPAHETPPGGA